MIDLSKLILLTTANTFKAENQVITGSFVMGGSAPEMNTTGMVTRTFNVVLPVDADYYDVMFNGPMVIQYTSPNLTLSTDRWAAPGRAVYRVLMNATGYVNYEMLFEIFTSISGNTLTITMVNQSQFLAASAVFTNTTINYRIIPYSATTQ